MGKADSYHAVTPIGTFTIDKAFGIADDPGCQMEYTKVTEDDYWSGDMREGMHFNEFVKIGDVPGLDPEACEHLIDYTYEYQYCLNMGYNSECTPGEGAAFFFHCMSLVKPYTGGCVAVNEAVMKLIMQRVKDGCKITINKADALGIDPGTKDPEAVSGRYGRDSFFCRLHTLRGTKGSPEKYGSFKKAEC